jgi:ABC-type microcin C transport system duplicated ATPase subunit YejF
MNRVAIIALVVVVTVLMMVKVPLDLRTHQLSLTATLRAMIAVALIVVMDAWIADALSTAVLSVIVVLAVAGVYAMTHHVAPQSLGWETFCWWCH